MAVLLGGCSSAGRQVATRAGDTAPTVATTTTAAVLPAAPPTSAVAGTVATVAPTATTAAPKAARAVQTAAPADTVTTLPGATTTSAQTATTVQVTTTVQGPTTTVAPTTTTTVALEKVSALGTSGDCDKAGTTYGVQSIVFAIDLPKLRADLAARGYAMPEAFQFRDYKGDAVAPAVERNVARAQDMWNQCASDRGGKPGATTLRKVAGEGGSQVFAELVKAQMDALKFSNYGGITIN